MQRNSKMPMALFNCNDSIAPIAGAKLLLLLSIITTLTITTSVSAKHVRTLASYYVSPEIASGLTCDNMWMTCEGFGWNGEYYMGRDNYYDSKCQSNPEDSSTTTSTYAIDQVKYLAYQGRMGSALQQMLSKEGCCPQYFTGDGSSAQEACARRAEGSIHVYHVSSSPTCLQDELSSNTDLRFFCGCNVVGTVRDGYWKDSETAYTQVLREDCVDDCGTSSYNIATWMDSAALDDLIYNTAHSCGLSHSHTEATVRELQGTQAATYGWIWRYDQSDICKEAVPLPSELEIDTGALVGLLFAIAAAVGTEVVFTAVLGVPAVLISKPSFAVLDASSGVIFFANNRFLELCYGAMTKSVLVLSCIELFVVLVILIWCVRNLRGFKKTHRAYWETILLPICGVASENSEIEPYLYPNDPEAPQPYEEPADPDAWEWFTKMRKDSAVRSYAVKKVFSHEISLKMAAGEKRAVQNVVFAYQALGWFTIGSIVAQEIPDLVIEGIILSEGNAWTGLNIVIYGVSVIGLLFSLRALPTLFRERGKQADIVALMNVHDQGERNGMLGECFGDACAECCGCNDGIGEAAEDGAEAVNLDESDVAKTVLGLVVRKASETVVETVLEEPKPTPYETPSGKPLNSYWQRKLEEEQRAKVGTGGGGGGGGGGVDTVDSPPWLPREETEEGGAPLPQNSSPPLATAATGDNTTAQFVSRSSIYLPESPEPMANTGLPGHFDAADARGGGEIFAEDEPLPFLPSSDSSATLENKSLANADAQSERRTTEGHIFNDVFTLPYFRPEYDRKAAEEELKSYEISGGFVVRPHSRQANKLVLSVIQVSVYTHKMPRVDGSGSSHSPGDQNL